MISDDLLPMLIIADACISLYIARIPLRSIDYDGESTCSWWWYNRRARFWLSLRPSLAISVTGTASNNPPSTDANESWAESISSRARIRFLLCSKFDIHGIHAVKKRKEGKKEKKKGKGMRYVSCIEIAKHVVLCKNTSMCFFIRRYRVSVFLWKFFDTFISYSNESLMRKEGKIIFGINSGWSSEIVRR